MSMLCTLQAQEFFQEGGRREESKAGMELEAVLMLVSSLIERGSLSSVFENLSHWVPGDHIRCEVA